MKDQPLLYFAWGGTLMSAITANLSLAISIAAGLAAFVASVYSVLINRAKWRKIRAHETAVCRACKLNPGSVECPFPEEDRPADCALRIQ
jgi:hypothetical protein